MRPEPYVIGLTGNIATGKSTVAAMLARLGADVIDADRLAHEAMRRSTPVYSEIVARFGDGVLGPDGEIDRVALGAIVFADPEALRDLERIVHPAVVMATRERLARCTARVCVVEAIRLIEARMHLLCCAVWVVTSAREQQRARLMGQRGLTWTQAEQRIDAQPPAQAKLCYASRVIDNSGDLEATWRQVVAAWNAIPGVEAVCGDVAWATMTKDERG